MLVFINHPNPITKMSSPNCYFLMSCGCYRQTDRQTVVYMMLNILQYCS